MDLIEIHIKNMVCPRCKMAVRQILDTLEVKHSYIELGKALIQSVDDKKMNSIEKQLNNVGFEILRDRSCRIVEQAKLYCRAYLKKLENEFIITNLSHYLAIEMGMNYSHLSKLFSKQEGQTLESYFLMIKIQRVKDLLREGELSLSEIAVKLKYSSVQYLSTQFKRIAKCSVSDYLHERKIA